MSETIKCCPECGGDIKMSSDAVVSYDVIDGHVDYSSPCFHDKTNKELYCKSCWWSSGNIEMDYDDNVYISEEEDHEDNTIETHKSEGVTE